MNATLLRAKVAVIEKYYILFQFCGRVSLREVYGIKIIKGDAVSTGRL